MNNTYAIMVHELDLRASLPVKHIPQPLMLCAPPSAANLYIRGLPYNNLVDLEAMKDEKAF